MPGRRLRKFFPVQALELAWATPIVVTHRLARATLAGSSPSSRDRREFHRMTVEKYAAFYESWNAMAFEAFRASQSLALAVLQDVLFPRAGFRSSRRLPAARARHAALGILAEGMAPVHRRAIRNARRLQRTRLR